MTVHTTFERIDQRKPAPGPLAAHVDRIDRGIEEAEGRVEEQKQRIREAALAGCNTAQDRFDLEKMQLLLAILREGRARLLERASALS